MRTILAALLLSMVPPVMPADQLADVITRVRPGVVAVGTLYPPRQSRPKGDRVAYRGTGFVVGNGQQVVTNAHVIPAELDRENNQALVIFVGRGAEARGFPAQVIREDREHDLALLQIDREPLPSLSLGDSDLVREGQSIAFTGFPLGVVLGLYPVTHRGIVSAITPMVRPLENARSLKAAHLRRRRSASDYDVFQLDATAYPGNSGSPVFDAASGRVVGVLNSVFVKESRESMLAEPSGISYAIPVRYVEELLSGQP